MRAVNTKISARANESLNRRAASLAMKKRLFIVISILVVSLAILLFSTVLTFAKSNNKQISNTEYTSIQIHSGDSLWSIAEENTDGFNMSVTDYIDEVKSLNQLSSDQIHSGQYLVVPVFH